MDKMNESRGMKARLGESYHWTDEDNNTVLPKGAMFKDYPKCDYINEDGYPDTLTGVDDFKNSVVSGINKNMSKIKY